MWRPLTAAQDILVTKEKGVATSLSGFISSLLNQGYERILSHTAGLTSKYYYDATLNNEMKASKSFWFDIIHPRILKEVREEATKTLRVIQENFEVFSPSIVDATPLFCNIITEIKLKKTAGNK